MDLPVMLREALELQILEQEPERAAAVIGTGVSEHGAGPVASVLLEASAIALRRMVAVTDEAFDLAELLAQLALDGAVPEHRLELLTDILTAAGATAGGIARPSTCSSSASASRTSSSAPGSACSPPCGSRPSPSRAPKRRWSKTSPPPSAHWTRRRFVLARPSGELRRVRLVMASIWAAIAEIGRANV